MFDENNEIIKWLLEGDISIQYQTKRDLLGENNKDLQDSIERNGWGKMFLDLRSPDGRWGKGLYGPKWISTHYTLLDLRNLNISPDNKECKESALLLLDKNYIVDIFSTDNKKSRDDVCVVAMTIDMLCYFKIDDSRINIMIDYLLNHEMTDGGWNCDDRRGAVHSSFHTTLSVLECFNTYKNSNYNFRIDEINAAIKKGQDFLLLHRLYKSHRTGEVVHPALLHLSYPCRWKYNILRCLDYFRSSGRKYEPEMQDALDIIKSKKTENNKWKVQYKHTGLVHFDMEKTGTESRWNTLRALRVLNYFNQI